MLENSLFSYATEQAAKRDIALAQVSENSGDWASLCMIEMREFRNNPYYHTNYPNGFTMTHIRTWLTPLIGPPHHPNAFGALAMKLIKAGIIEDTGAISRLGAKARKQPVYRWV
jgi:hypothetical protein